MPRVEVILRTCIEAAEVEYLRAKGGGMPDPVVELVCFDPEHPHTVGLAVWDRPELARSMDERSTGAAAAIREAPPDGCPFTIVVATLDCVQIFHRPVPSSG
jgi:hypothetical protein